MISKKIGKFEFYAVVAEGLGLGMIYVHGELILLLGPFGFGVIYNRE
jgi:hypothetical protein